MFYEALMGKQVAELEPMIRRIQQAGQDQLALAMQQKEQPSATPEELAHIQVPVLVVNGDHDKDNGSAEDLSRMIKNSRLVIVPGNHGEVVVSQAFSDAVVNFFRP